MSADLSPVPAGRIGPGLGVSGRPGFAPSSSKTDGATTMPVTISQRLNRSGARLANDHCAFLVLAICFELKVDGRPEVAEHTYRGQGCIEGVLRQGSGLLRSRQLRCALLLRLLRRSSLSAFGAAAGASLSHPRRRKNS